jgi:asparagine synthase (glutamine-hydrolysing)
MGHWHFWTTPEEVGERQPLELAGLPFKVVLDGRLDNRPELISELGLPSEEGRRLSDAALILHAYDHWGVHCLEHFIGPFALVIWDERCGELLCGRDALGDRTLFYSLTGTRLVVASEPWAVAGANDSSNELDDYAIAYYFALRVPEDGQTLFKNIQELLPAHEMAVHANGERQWRYWQPKSSDHVQGKSDREYAEEFRYLLSESVRCRLRSTTPVGVLMSGGLDSTSVACLAAMMIAPTPLTTISYVFDELTDCDERQFINSVKEKWGIHSIQIPCDDAWPFKDWPNWPPNPNQPDWNVYRLLKERAYQCANREGIRVLLTGEFGDHLYGAESDFLVDLIADGRYLDAGREFGQHIHYAGLRWTWERGYLQRVGRNFLNRITYRRHLHGSLNPPPAWLTSFSAGYLSQPGNGLDSQVEHQSGMLDLSGAMICAGETSYANRYALEQRYPYRDRRLVEYVLALPAYQLYYRGYIKYILRTAMQDILPQMIRNRTQPNRLLSLFFRGIERENHVLETYFQDHNSAWSRFVRADWLQQHWKIVYPPEQDGPQAVVPWLCMSFETWAKMAFTST